MLVHTPRGTEEWPNASVAQAVATGQLHPETQVSLDHGSTWIAAGLAAARLNARGDPGLALLVPLRTEGWSTGAGYLALFSLFFFGGPLAGAAAIAGLDPKTPTDVRLLFIVAAVVLGPLPPVAMAWLGFRGLAKDPTLRGRGRAIFALVVAGVMLIGPALGLFGTIFRR